MRRLPPVLVGIALLSTVNCSPSDGPTSPGSRPRDLRGSAFRVDVELRAGQVTITPVGAAARRASASRSGSAGGARPSASLVAGDVVSLVASNLSQSAPGQFQPGKVRVSFDVAIANTLEDADLGVPTFPTPPAGAQGLILIPYALDTRDGRRDGGPLASPDWDGDGSAGSGAPYDFFNDFRGCRGNVNTDCLRWERYPAPLLAGQTTAARRVGFDVPQGISSFTAYLLVAADVMEHGTVSGQVTGPLGGLAGVGVTASPGGQTATTDDLGNFSLRTSAGSTVLSLSSLPVGCNNLVPRRATVARGGTTTVTLVVPCSVTLAANAGADVDADLGRPVALDGSASTSTLSGALAYTWTQLSGPDVTGGTGVLTGVSPTFTAPSTVTTLEFDLRVSAGGTTSAPDRVVVFVLEDARRAYFVSTGGTDGNPGTRARPFHSIQHGIDVAASTRGDVYVSAGVYNESLTLRLGVSVYGGFVPNSWLRDPANQTTEIHGGPTAVIGVQVFGLTLDALRIGSAAPVADGGSSTGVMLWQSGDITISNSRIEAQSGHDGRDGVNGANGQAGLRGGDGTLVCHITLSSCVTNTGNPGLGANRGGGGGSGGIMVRGSSGDGTGYPGGPGDGPSSGQGGLGGFEETRSSINGEDGGDAQPPTVPTRDGARGDAIGRITLAGYLEASGGDGANGEAGAGGGGGGGGGTLTGGLGGPGGGGGGGGGGGHGGTGGQGGGGSLGIVIGSSATIVLTNDVIVTKNGGRGGGASIGGLGGPGGPGGSGAIGFTGLDGHGGNGGAGAFGSYGGCGGAGGGGPSIAILESADASAISFASSTLQVGQAGAGGHSVPWSSCTQGGPAGPDGVGAAHWKM